MTPDRTQEPCSPAHPLHRPVQVLLPPGWQGDPTRTFPVLYANDGQDMDRWRLRETVEHLIADRSIVPVIVVMIPATERRAHEYGIAGTPNARGMGDEADAYTAWVLDHLKPCIDTRYPTMSSPEHTAVMGASLGGLSAFDLAWNHPDVFGMAGVFSGSFWWRTDNRTPARKQSSRIAHRMVRRHGEGTLPRGGPGPRGGTLPRVWLQAGRKDESEDRDENGVIDSIQDVAELMEELQNIGYEPGRDLTYVEVDGGHDPGTWAEVLPGFLRWAFGTAGKREKGKGKRE